MLMVVAVVLMGCSENDEAVGDGRARVDVAFTLSGSTKSTTRMAESVMTPSTAADVSILNIIPLKGNTPDDAEIFNQQITNKTNSIFYHYSSTIAEGVNGCLVYGKTTATNYGGRLTATLPTAFSEATDLNTISFAPVQYISQEMPAPDNAGTLAGYLTDIATVSGWGENTSNNNLRALYFNFINNSHILAGSATNVALWIAQLKDELNGLSLTENSADDLIRDAVVQKINAKQTAMADLNLTYPRSYGLPDGAAVVRWTGSAFEPQTQTTSLASINTISRYAYPAELYYFVKSDIKVSDQLLDLNTIYSHATNWSGDNSVLSHFSGTDNNTVTAQTKAIALTDPVQFGVAQLKVTVKANAASLPDGAVTPASIPITHTDSEDKTVNNFPLTGIIVGGQRAVNYQFVQTTDDDVKVRLVYDGNVKTNGNDYYYLSTANPDNGPSTLLLPSYDGEKIQIILEFENQGTEKFTGLDGDVYPGTRFYLLGEIVPTYDGSTYTADYTKRVFTKDYITILNAKVSTLAKAYNVLPNILKPNLEVGVELTPQWIASPPTTVKLE